MKNILISIAMLVAVFGLSACTVKPTELPADNTAINNETASMPDANSASTEDQNSNMTEETTSNAAPQSEASIKAPADQPQLIKDYSRALIKTSLGNIKVKFYADKSPVTVNNFMYLAQSGFYDGSTFHRVIKDFMIQGGDPNSKDDDWSNDGFGGTPYRFADEFNDVPLVAGSLAMANSGPNTNGSQFFIVTAEATPWLDGKHTNFGQVIEGLDIVKKIEGVAVNANDHPIHDVKISGIELLK